MIWGLEGRHQWDSGVILNRKVDDSGARVLPRCKLTRIGGLSALADSEDVRELAVGRIGEIPRRSYRRGKTVTYELVVQALSLSDLRTYESQLRAAFFDQSVEKIMEVTPHPTYDVSGAARFFRARALACDIGDEQGPVRKTFQRLYERSGVISVRMADPRYYDSALLDEIVTVANGNDVGTLECDVGGTVPTDPVITVVGPSGDIPKGAVDFATTAALPANTRVGNVLTANANGSLPTIDSYGEAPATLLVKNEASGLKNGIYDLTDWGSATRPWILTRRADADTSAEVVNGITVPVLYGATNAGKTFRLTTANPITLNTTALTFSLLTTLGLKLTNADIAKSLIFPTLHLNGSTLVVDFRTRTILLDGLSREDLLDDDASDWWDAGVSGLDPLDNQTVEVRSFTGAATTFDVDVTVAWHSAFA